MACCKVSPPAYSANVMRLLSYPPQINSIVGKEHIDRGLFTIHLGDQGGKLLAIDNYGNEVCVSPKPGQVLIFFGVKCLWASKGKVRPLRHKAVSTPNHLREAVVTFWHTDNLDGYKVTNAANAERYFDSLIQAA